MKILQLLHIKSYSLLFIIADSFFLLLKYFIIKAAELYY